MTKNSKFSFLDFFPRVRQDLVPRLPVEPPVGAAAANRSSH